MRTATLRLHAQDAKKAVEALKQLDVPYLCSLPLVFQTTEEWLDSELGVHPVQVALQVRWGEGWESVYIRACHAARPRILRASALQLQLGKPKLLSWCQPYLLSLVREVVALALPFKDACVHTTRALMHACTHVLGQVALPELDGAMEPIVFAGRDSNSGKSHSLPDRISSLCSRAIKWANLRKKKNAEKRLAVTVFSFPPDKVRPV